jgi:hypothetical protein
MSFVVIYALPLRMEERTFVYCNWCGQIHNGYTDILSCQTCSAIMSNVINQGNVSTPAWDRYGGWGYVSCDACGREDIPTCVGVTDEDGSSEDLCMECVYMAGGQEAFLKFWSQDQLDALMLRMQ